VFPAKTAIAREAIEIRSPADEATFLRNLLGLPRGNFVRDGMSILGVDGNQAMYQAGMPPAGKVRVKDGSRVVGSPSGQAYLPAVTHVGYNGDQEQTPTRVCRLRQGRSDRCRPGFDPKDSHDRLR
jgi:hypothetical protein